MPQETATRDFNSYLINIEHVPHSGIVDRLNNNRIPFKKNIFFRYNPVFLAAQEWNRCVEFYLQKTPNGNMTLLSNVMDAINQDERPHQEELKELAVKIVKEMYGIPDSINLLPEIDNSSSEDLGHDNDVAEELTQEQKDKIEPYIQKRIILNSIAHGAAVHQWVSAFYLGYEELNEMNPNLITHYDSYASLINYFNWMHPLSCLPDQQFNQMVENGMIMTQGFNKVDFEKEEIKAQGNNFPVLIHELSKGALEYLLGSGIPEDLSADELSYLYEEADKYSDEFWHYYMGPTLWRGLLNSANVESNELAPILSYMSKMEYEDLADLCKKIVFDTDEEGKKQLNIIKKQTK